MHHLVGVADLSAKLLDPGAFSPPRLKDPSLCDQ
jgi:hypothetical protein